MEFPTSTDHFIPLRNEFPQFYLLIQRKFGRPNGIGKGAWGPDVFVGIQIFRETHIVVGFAINWSKSAGHLGTFPALSGPLGSIIF
ncbi:MAG: hypothetical protein CM1200mP4_3530 [Rhodospirillaceae bacterium]|nr:MAG: hypothetical protein CM1200mP4_3530 [Rhodospirillaceae bacterium]